MSIRTFFADVLNNKARLDEWLGSDTEKQNLIENSRFLTKDEQAILKTGDEFLISMRMALWEGPDSGMGGPGKEGGPGPGP